jgi:hypothetical protein
VRGCYDEWEDARDLLHDGTFAGFLAGLGRADLVRAAREAQALPDRDIALTNFVATLPATQVQGPKLGISPRRLVVGPMRVGEQRPAHLRITNEGRGILQGKLTVAEGSTWLKVADGADPTSLPLHTSQELSAALRIDTRGLVVGQNYSGKLVVVTNGGVTEIPIRLDLSVRPFARAPYQGAQSPHDLARKMRDNPHPAVPMLESGEIARWFESNGWTYPIVGSTAPGLASVQQFFEELGLARAPQIQISAQEMQFSCNAQEVLPAQVTIRSPARKLVYGRAESDSPWLKVQTNGISGQVQAAIDFAIDANLMPDDGVYYGSLKVVANAGQTFHVRVQVEVKGNKKSWFGSRKPTSGTIPVATAVPAPPPVPSPPSHAAPLPAWLPAAPAPMAAPPTLTPVGPSGSIGRVVLVGLMLGLVVRLLLVIPADIYARLLGSTQRQPAPGSLAAWLQVPLADEGFLKLLALSTWWLGALVGAYYVWRRGGRWTDIPFGLLAGGIAGIATSATVGCVLVAGDALPRALISATLGQRAMASGLATSLWIVTAVLCWALVGGVSGFFLGLCGSAGRRVLAWLARPVSSTLRKGGLVKAADWFELRPA